MPEQAEGLPRYSKNKSRFQAIQEIRAQMFRERARLAASASGTPPRNPYAHHRTEQENSNATFIGSLSDVDSMAIPASLTNSNENSSSGRGIPGRMAEIEILKQEAGRMLPPLSNNKRTTPINGTNTIIHSNENSNSTAVRFSGNVDGNEKHVSQSSCIQQPSRSNSYRRGTSIMVQSGDPCNI